MGNRRLGARRLAALDKRGQEGLDASLQSGEGMKNAIVSHRVSREGAVITTEIHVDLQGKPGSGHAFFSPAGDAGIIGATTYVPVATDNAATQETNAGNATVAGAHLMQWSNAVHGRIFETDVIVLEKPNTDGADKSDRIDISFATYGATDALNTTLDNVTLRLVQQADALAEGDRHLLPLGDDANAAEEGEAVRIQALADCNEKALYLSCPAHDNPGIHYTAGQFLITLRGYDTTVGF